MTRNITLYNQAGTADRIIFFYQTDNGWVNSLQFTYQYDGNGNQIETMQERFFESTWVNFERHQSAFNGNNDEIQNSTEVWNDLNSRWVNQFMVTASFNNDGLWTNYSTLEWKNDKWVNVRRSTQMYDAAGRQLQLTHAEGDDQRWINTRQSLYAYDNSGNNISTHDQEWSSETASWIDHAVFDYNFDDNDNLLERSHKYWIGDPKESVTTTTFYTYGSIVANEPGNASADLNFTLNHYPNPATETSNISFDLAQPADISLELYDLLGRRIKTILERQLPAGGHSVQVELSDLPNGIYFYRLSAGGEVQSAKVLVMN